MDTFHFVAINLVVKRGKRTLPTQSFRNKIAIVISPQPEESES